MHKITSGAPTAETIKNSSKGTIKCFAASDNAFSFMSSAKETSAYWKQFLYDILAIVKACVHYFLSNFYFFTKW